MLYPDQTFDSHYNTIAATNVPSPLLQRCYAVSPLISSFMTYHYIQEPPSQFHYVSPPDYYIHSGTIQVLHIHR